MAPKATLEKIESREEYDFHNESVLLISENQQCYGYDLEEILCDLLEHRNAHGNQYDHTSHNRGYDLLRNASIEEKIMSIENSVWLVRDVCFDDEELDLVSTIQSDLPPQAEVIVWSNPNDSQSPDEDISDIEESSEKIFHVADEGSLRTALTCYFTRDCNPRRSSHCVEWNNEARRAQKMIL
jgi:hypothetical protein